MNLSHYLPTTRYSRLLRICGVVALACPLGAGLAQAAEPQDLFPAPVYVTLQSSNAVEHLPADSIWDGLSGAHYDAISADGTRMLVSSKDLPKAWLLDAHTGKKLATFEIGPVPQGVTISPNGDWGLAVSAGDGSVSVIDIRKQNGSSPFPWARCRTTRASRPTASSPTSPCKVAAAWP